MCTTAMVGFLHAGTGGPLDPPHCCTSGSAPFLRSLPLLAGYPTKTVHVKLCQRAPPCGRRCSADAVGGWLAGAEARRLQSGTPPAPLGAALVAPMDSDPLLLFS